MLKRLGYFFTDYWFPLIAGAIVGFAAGVLANSVCNLGPYIWRAVTAAFD